MEQAKKVLKMRIPSQEISVGLEDDSNFSGVSNRMWITASQVQSIFPNGGALAIMTGTYENGPTHYIPIFLPSEVLRAMQMGQEEDNHYHQLVMLPPCDTEETS